MQPRHAGRVARGAALGALVALAMAGTAVAAPSAEFALHVGDAHEQPTGSPPTVCEFHLHASVAGEAESGHWEVWTADGSSLVEAGLYDAAPGADDVIPDPGSMTLDDGAYQLRWDDEPIDRSRGTIDFVVDCPEAPAATATPTPTGGVEAETGTPAPTASATPTPAGGVLAETGTPGMTLPPTDSAMTSETPRSQGAIGLAAMLVLASVAVLAATRPIAAVVRERRRR